MDELQQHLEDKHDVNVFSKTLRNYLLTVVERT